MPFRWESETDGAADASDGLIHFGRQSTTFSDKNKRSLRHIPYQNRLGSKHSVPLARLVP